MKRNFDLPLLELDGTPFADKATLKSVCFLMLTTPLQGDNDLPLDQRLKHYALVQAVHKGGVVDVSAEDIALLKARAAKCLSLIAVGRVCELLEQEEQPKTTE